MSAKPSPAAIRSTQPLTALWAVRGRTLFCCTICGLPSLSLTIWREHDERDRPLEGARSCIFIGKDHASCLRTMNDHPRLYAEETGEPGMFPMLCGDCPNRVGFLCTHPDLKANGGEGLKVHLDSWPAGAIICSRGGGCYRPVRHAVSCVGKQT